MNQGRSWPVRLLDIYIAISLLTVLVASVIASFAADQDSLQRWLNNNFRLLVGVAVMQCLLMLLWMLLGGYRSVVWELLPPFCFFRPVIWVRWVIILMLIGGTIAGMVSMHALRSEQDQRSIETGRQ